MDKTHAYMMTLRFKKGKNILLIVIFSGQLAKLLKMAIFSVLQTSAKNGYLETMWKERFSYIFILLQTYKSHLYV